MTLPENPEVARQAKLEPPSEGVAKLEPEGIARAWRNEIVGTGTMYTDGFARGERIVR